MSSGFSVPISTSRTGRRFRCLLCGRGRLLGRGRGGRLAHRAPSRGALVRDENPRPQTHLVGTETLIFEFEVERLADAVRDAERGDTVDDGRRRADFACAGQAPCALPRLAPCYLWTRHSRAPSIAMEHATAISNVLAMCVLGAPNTLNLARFGSVFFAT